MLKRFRAGLISAVLIVMLAVPAAVSAEGLAKDTVRDADAFSPVQLRHWKNSPQNERYAFLIGFFSILELEHAWQGKQALPISQSINSSWVRGLSGKTLQEISAAVDQYYHFNPGAEDTPVVEVIGRIYVKPVLTEAERKAAAARYDKLKAEGDGALVKPVSKK